MYLIFSHFTSYGPAGHEIIVATLRHHIYSPAGPAVKTLTGTVADILDAHAHADLPAFWIGSTANTLLLTEFINYVAGPQVANMLIAHDLSVTESNADEMRLESMKYGLYHHRTNEEIEDIVMRIAAPKRV